MGAAGIFIAACFVALAFFSLLIITPGLLLYRAGMKSAFAEMTTPQNNPKIIDVTPTNAANDIGAKGKALLKSGARKLRNYLNKFAD
jgi:hypothetical protein